MFLGGSISYLVYRLIQFYSLLIFVYVIMSWLPIRSGLALDIYKVLASVCEPFIGLFRRILPASASGGSGLDFSPMVAILVLQIVGPYIARLIPF